MIDGAELLRRGYRTIRGESYCLLAPGNVRLKRDQQIEFSNGEKVEAGDIAKRLISYRPKPTMRQVILAAKRRHRQECKKCHR